MDVFGAVTSAINLATKLVGYIQAVKGAKEDRRKLLPEISVLGALLHVLRGRLANSATKGAGGSFSDRLVMAGIENPLRECEEALQDTATRLERLVLDTSSGKPLSFTEMMKDIRWPFRQGEVKTMLDRIERLKSLVSLAFQTSLMCAISSIVEVELKVRGTRGFVEKAHDELMAVGLNVEKIGTTVSAIEADQRVHMQKTESLHVDLQALGWTLRDSANTIMKIESTVARMEKDRQDQTSEKILNWLSSLDFSGKHNAAFEKRAPGTGEWFLEHPKFLAWQQGNYQVLWCPGGPGVGKSVMASIVIRHLQGMTSKDVTIIYIYFDYTIKYTITQLFEALLSQLVRRRPTRSGVESLRSWMEAGNRPTLDELINIFKAEAEAYTRVFIAVDALDETEIQIWVPLFRRLRVLSGISILATSRDIREIALELQPYQRLDVMADKEDMRKYIRERLSNCTGTLNRLLRTNASLHEEIVTGVTEKAAGMFLLARLHMNSLEKRSRITDLRRALIELPGDLNTTYDETIGRIDDEDKSLAHHIFSWLTHAAKPMTIRDLQYALAVEEGMTDIDPNDLRDEDYLMSICVGLVVLQDSGTTYIRRNGAVGFVHYSTQAYFCKYVSTYLPHPAHLAITCLRYLSFSIFNTNEPPGGGAWEQRLNIPFAEYAISSWGKHARTHYDNATVRDLAMQLLHDDRRVVTVGSHPCRTRKPSAIHLCAHFGLNAYLEYLLDNGFDINLRDSEGDTALTQAAVYGQEVMQLLLARDGVDVNPKGRNGATPLSQAIIHGQQGIMELLLARSDVDVNSRDNKGMTPIAHAAIERQQDGIAKLLVRDDVDINLQNASGRTPLMSAMCGRHEAIIQLLLARDDLDTSLKDSSGRTHLAIAVRYYLDQEIIKSLLAKGGADINWTENRTGMTVLTFAAYWSEEEVVKLLLEQGGIEINPVDGYGQTPLDWAEKRPHEGIAQLLRAAGGRKHSELQAEAQARS